MIKLSYTGMNDKNNVEIHEGDTITGRTIVGILWKDVVGKVIYYRGGGYYALVGKDFHQPLDYVNNMEKVL